MPSAESEEVLSAVREALSNALRDSAVIKKAQKTLQETHETLIKLEVAHACSQTGSFSLKELENQDQGRPGNEGNNSKKDRR